MQEIQRKRPQITAHHMLFPPSFKRSSRATASRGKVWPRVGLRVDKEGPKCPKLGAEGAAPKRAEEREDEEKAK